MNKSDWQGITPWKFCVYTVMMVNFAAIRQKLVYILRLNTSQPKAFCINWNRRHRSNATLLDVIKRPKFHVYNNSNEKSIRPFLNSQPSVWLFEWIILYEMTVFSNFQRYCFEIEKPCTKFVINKMQMKMINLALCLINKTAKRHQWHNQTYNKQKEFFDHPCQTGVSVLYAA